MLIAPTIYKYITQNPMGLQKINYLSSDVPFYEEKANSSMCIETKAYKTCECVLKKRY